MTNDLARLFDRDIQRLFQEISAYPSNESLWKVVDGISNSAGNLALHLSGNLNEYIGRILGDVAYQRNRPREFSTTGLDRDELLTIIKSTQITITQVLALLKPEDLTKPYPEEVLGYSMSVQYFLIHLNGHLNYHLGQIDYHRRILTKEGAIKLAS